jgi:NADH:ubiquinone oxidoreductase subunit E
MMIGEQQYGRMTPEAAAQIVAALRQNVLS